MMKQFVILPAALTLVLCSLQVKAEVLGHISDETEPAASAPDSVQNNDRRIIYRVICTPGGEVLPDCEQPFNDTESLVKPVPQQKVDSIADDADLMDETAEQATTATATDSKKTVKKTKKSKKSSSKKKTGKKASTKKTSNKKK